MATKNQIISAIQKFLEAFQVEPEEIHGIEGINLYPRPSEPYWYSWFLDEGDDKKADALIALWDIVHAQDQKQKTTTVEDIEQQMSAVDSMLTSFNKHFGDSE